MKKLLLLLSVLCFLSEAHAGSITPPGTTSQVIVNNGNNQFGAVTLFDPTYQSLEVPVGTTGTRPAIPVTGMLRYNSATPAFEGFNGSTWGPIAGSGVPGGSSGQLQYNNSGAFGGITIGSTITTASSTINTTQPADRIVSGTTDTITSADAGVVVKYTSSSAVAVGIASASTSGLTQGFAFVMNNAGTNTVTLTPTSSTINGASSFAIPTMTGCWVRSDGTNYQIDFASCNALPITTANLPNNIQYRVLGISLGGIGTAITTGVAGAPYVSPYSGTITSYSLTSSSSCSIVIDVWKRNAAIPTISNTITASALPTLSSAQYVNTSTLTGWTTSVAANDVFVYNVNSVSGCTAATLELVMKTN